MDPYVIVTRLRDYAKRCEDAYWRFDDRLQLVLSETFDKYEARQPAKTWYEMLLYGFIWLAEGYGWLLELLMRTYPVQAWQRRQQAKRDLERLEFRRQLDREFAAERAREEAEEERRRRHARYYPTQAPQSIPAPKPTPAEIAAAEVAAAEEEAWREARIRDRAERDWNARNIRLSDVKYWDDPSDPRRWYNPPFPG